MPTTNKTTAAKTSTNGTLFFEKFRFMGLCCPARHLPLCGGKTHHFKIKAARRYYGNRGRTCFAWAEQQGSESILRPLGARRVKCRGDYSKGEIPPQDCLRRARRLDGQRACCGSGEKRSAGILHHFARFFGRVSQGKGNGFEGIISNFGRRRGCEKSCQ